MLVISSHILFALSHSCEGQFCQSCTSVWIIERNAGPRALSQQKNRDQEERGGGGKEV